MNNLLLFKQKLLNKHKEMNNPAPAPSAQTQVPPVIQTEQVQKEAESAPICDVVPEKPQIQEAVVEKPNKDNDKLNLLKNMLRSMVKNVTETRPQIASKKQESPLEVNNQHNLNEFPRQSSQKVINESIMVPSKEQIHHQYSNSQQLFVIQVKPEGPLKKIQKYHQSPQVMDENSVSNHDNDEQNHPQQPKIENQAENNISLSVPQQHEQEKIQQEKFQQENIKEPQQGIQEREDEEPIVIRHQPQQDYQNINQEKPPNPPEPVMVIANQEINAEKQQKQSYQDTQMKVETPVVAPVPEIPNKLKLMMQKMKKLKGQPQKIIQKPQQIQYNQQKPLQLPKDKENIVKQVQNQRVSQEIHGQGPLQSQSHHEITEKPQQNESMEIQQQEEDDDQDGYQSEVAQQAQDLQKDQQGIKQQSLPKDLINQLEDEQEGQQQQMVEEGMLESEDQREKSRLTKKQQKQKKIMLKELYTILDYTKKMKHTLTNTFKQTITKPAGKPNLREIIERIKESLIM